MTIQRGGPPRAPGAPRGPLPSGRSGAPKKAAKAAPQSADVYTEGAAGATPRPSAPRPRAAGPSPALVRQSLERLEREIHEREGELTRLLGVALREGAKQVSKRHQAQLAALKRKLAEARARATKGRRALLELERGAESVPRSRLERLEVELEALEGEPEGPGRARAAIDLLLALAEEEPARRLSVRAADKQDALAYAERESPEGLLADVAAAALDGFGPTVEPEEALGPGLGAQRRLSRALRGGRKR